MILPKPLRILWSAWALPWGIMSTAFFSLTVLLGGLLGMNADKLQMLARSWAKFLLWGIGCRVRVAGLEHLEPEATYVFACNHSSMLDIAALQVALPPNFRWIAKKELFAIPVFGAAMLKAGYIPIDRSDSRAALVSLQEAAARIRGGASVLIFPEGTRSLDGRLLPFKNGGFVLALRSGRPVAPVALLGSGRALPAKSLLINPGLIEVRFGAPLPTEGIKGAGREELVRETRRRVLALLDQEESAPQVDTSPGVA